MANHNNTKSSSGSDAQWDQSSHVWAADKKGAATGCSNGEAMDVQRGRLPEKNPIYSTAASTSQEERSGPLGPSAEMNVPRCCRFHHLTESSRPAIKNQAECLLVCVNSSVSPCACKATWWISHQIGEKKAKTNKCIRPAAVSTNSSATSRLMCSRSRGPRRSKTLEPHSVHGALASKWMFFLRPVSTSHRRCSSLLFRINGQDNNSNNTTGWLTHWPNIPLLLHNQIFQSNVRVKIRSLRHLRRLLATIDWFKLAPSTQSPSQDLFKLFWHFKLKQKPRKFQAKKSTRRWLEGNWSLQTFSFIDFSSIQVAFWRNFSPGAKRVLPVAIIACDKRSH